MRGRRNYPGRGLTYDRTSWDSRQSDVPSQQMAVGTPYDNSYQADIASLGSDGAVEAFISSDAQASGVSPGGAGGGPGPGGPGGAGGNSFVRHTFESRPVFSRDWVSPAYPDQNNHAKDGAGTFQVPNGYVGIVREVYLRPDFNVSGDIFGNPAHTYSISILVNGNPVPGYTFIDGSFLFPLGGTFETFILLNPGDVITGNAFFSGTGGVPADVGFSFYGQLLVNDGRDLPQYAGNAQCEPVCLDAGSIAQIKPPPLVMPTAQGPVVVTKPPSVTANNCPLPPAVSVNDYLACVMNQPGFAPVNQTVGGA